MAKLIDLTGKRFGMLTVIRREPNGKFNQTRWLCKCDCGNEKVIDGNNLRAGYTQSCGCMMYTNTTLIDLTGQRFGKLTVIKRASDSSTGKTRWLCKCDCGNEKIVIGGNLKRGHTQSCGCAESHSHRQHSPIIDLTGQKFGHLMVIELAPNSDSGKTRWLCKCDCGNEKVVATGNLRSGKTKSCGCMTQHPKTLQDLTGMRFGMLTVIERASNSNTGLTRWLCKCDCGNEKIIIGNSLKRGRSRSCGWAEKATPTFKDLTGIRFGRLTVIERAANNNSGDTRWLCKCDCGNTTVITSYDLQNGHTRSCGCIRAELQKDFHKYLHYIDNTCIETLGKRKGNNPTGIAGIYKKKDGKYRAAIVFQGKTYHLGTYSSLNDAVKARERGLEMHFDYLDKFYEEHPEAHRKDHNNQ